MTLMEKLFYTLSEVASELGETSSCVRFWSNSFSSLVKPVRNAKGNRLYKKEDLEMLRRVQYLLKVEGVTIEGAKKRMNDDGSKKEQKILSTLKEIKSQLLEIKRYM